MKLLAEQLDDIIEGVYTASIVVAVSLLAIFIGLVIFKDYYAAYSTGRPDNITTITYFLAVVLSSMVAPIIRRSIAQRVMQIGGFYTKFKFFGYYVSLCVSAALRCLPALFGAYLSVKTGAIYWYMGLGVFSAVTVFVDMPTREELRELFPGSKI